MGVFPAILGFLVLAVQIALVVGIVWFVIWTVRSIRRLQATSTRSDEHS
ncbi:hypothetical protein G3H63_16700 [Microbacterium resistens]|nr:hypothetical protein [Microbacterium resistens]MBW1640704.1 hypothetical protein [Microbacterium resistens]